MKKRFRALESTRFGALIPIFVCLIAVVTSATAAELKQARVTQVIKDVKLLPGQAAARPAAVNDEVRGGTAVRTGVDSRTELKFADLTITRLGANTIFSFNEGTRNLNLSNGAILVQVPKNGAEVKITTAAATAAITGGTVLFSTGPPAKFMVFEGTGRLCSKLGDCVTLHGGEMSMMVNGHPANPQTFNAKLAWGTALLVVGFPDQSNLLNLDLIRAVFADQLSGQPGGTSNQPGLTKDITDVISQSTVASGATTSGPTATPLPTPTGTPSKFGPPTVITSPDPYVITSGTTISTDPTITTNGHTDLGKIWRGPAIDGPLSAFIFGSTSAFDTVSGFDTELNGNMGGAGFKFSSLQLTGNPTVSTTTGVINLGLIAVNGITSGGPGGVLTFAGIHGLLIATQNGPINLGSEISFSGLHDINFYARGASSDLTLGSDINTSSEVRLFAERDMSVTSNITTETFLAVAGRNITISDPAIIHAGALTLTVANNGGGHIGTGGNISVTTRGDLVTTGGGGEAFTIQNTTGTIDNGGAITLMIGGGLSTQALSLFVENWDFTVNAAGHIGAGGNIFVTTKGDLAADSIDALINNRAGGTIDSGGNLRFNIAGSLTTRGDASFIISSRFDNFNGSTLGSAIGSDVTLEVRAGSVNIGGSLISATFGGTDSFSGISNRGGTIGGNATYKWDVSGGDITIHGDAALSILNDDGPVTNLDGSPGAGSPIGGTIHGNATLQLSAANLTAGSLRLQINNRNGGVSGPGGMIDSDASITLTITGDLHTTTTDAFVQINNSNIGAGSGGVIGSGATITLNLAGNLIAQTDATFAIQNAFPSDKPGGSGGMIGKDAVLNLNVKKDIFIGGAFDTSIRNARNAGNAGGNIRGSAILTLAVTGSISAHDDLQFVNNGGGTIGSDAKITVSAASLATTDTKTGALSVSMANNAGSIGGGAAINFGPMGALSSQSDAIFSIDNSGSGTIAGDAAINLSAASISSVGGFFDGIENFNSGRIGSGSSANGATIKFGLTGALTSQSFATFSIQNQNGGTIASDAAINLSAANISSVGVFFAGIANNNSGSIGSGSSGGGAAINFGLTGALTSQSGATFSIQNQNGGTIASDAAINLSAANVSSGSGGVFFAGIANNNSGTIGSGSSGGGAAINVGITGALTSESGATFSIDNHNSGTIASDATVNVNAASITTSGFFFADIFNRAGHIGGNAIINFGLSGNLSTGRIEALIDNSGQGTIGSGENITFNIGGNMTASTDAFFLIDNSRTVTLRSAISSSRPAINVSANNISITTGLFAWIDDSINGGPPSGTGGTVKIQANGTINTGSFINVLGDVIAGGDITSNSLSSTNVTTPGRIIVGNGGIQRFRQSFTNQFPNVLHTLNAALVTSQGGIDFNGVAANGSASPATDGGQLTINANSLSFGVSDSTADIKGPVTFNGGDASASFPSGNGGTFNVNTSGPITVDSAIEATSGFQDPSAPPSGNGGTVNLKSSGDTVTVNSRIEVSSTPPVTTLVSSAVRRSAKGGTINITSGKAGGIDTRAVAINVSNSAQLLALLDAAAPGPGGKITILATGANSDINVNGRVQADRGAVDIRHTGDNGQINLATGTGDTINMRGDIVKVGALGNNGRLNIGGGTISADTMLKLYAPGSNGLLNFIANVTLSSGTAANLAAATITIQPTFTVTIAGAGGKANVFTNNPNYSGFGGNNPRNGTFGGNGANNPQPLANAPPFD